MDIFDSRYFVINKILLTTVGLWPYQNGKRKFCLRICMTFIMIVGIMVPQMISCYINLGVNMDLLVEHIATLIYVIGIYLKFLTSTLTENKLKIVYDNVAKNWKMLKEEHETNILYEYSENGRLLTIGYILYMLSAAALFVSLPATPILLDEIKPLNESRPRIFVFGGEFFVDSNEYYSKIYIFDCFCCCVTVLLVCAVDSMYAACIEHCLGLFAIIKFRLQMCTKFTDQQQNLSDLREDMSYKQIIRTIQLHKEIINFTDILESSYSSSFLILVGLNLFLLSFESILLIIKLDQVMEFIRFLMIVVGVTIHLFYISWPGQKLIDASSSLHGDAYTNEWYECSIKAQKLLRFFTLRCKKPCQLTAGGLYVMNFENFACVIFIFMNSYESWKDRLFHKTKIKLEERRLVSAVNDF